MNMRLSFIAAAAALAIPALSSAQEIGNVTYSLPLTTVQAEVTAVHEAFFAGPYAQYAKKYLGLDVRQKNSSSVRVTGVTFIPKVEADAKARFSVAPGKTVDSMTELSAQGLVSFGSKAEAESVSWRFTPYAKSNFNNKGLTSPDTVEKRTTYRDVQTDTSFTRIAVQQDFVVTKTLEQKAKEAAEIILKARREKFNITTGNTDATFSGEALGSAIAELTRVEEEYLTMFVGYSVYTDLEKTFEVTPSPTKKNGLYPLFAAGRDGLVPAEEGGDQIFYLFFDPQELTEPEIDPAKAAKPKSSLHYRVPAICTVTLSNDDKDLVSMRIPVYQLGREEVYPITK